MINLGFEDWLFHEKLIASMSNYDLKKSYFPIIISAKILFFLKKKFKWSFVGTFDSFAGDTLIFYLV